MCDDKAAGILAIDSKRINELVLKAHETLNTSNRVLTLISESGIVVEPTIFGMTFSIAVRVAEPKDDRG